MTRDEIRAMIQEILSDLLDDPALALTDSTSASDVADWDSINHVRLLIAIEREQGFRFTNEEAGGLSDVGQMVDLIQKKLTA